MNNINNRHGKSFNLHVTVHKKQQKAKYLAFYDVIHETSLKNILEHQQTNNKRKLTVVKENDIS
jgi:hypothetical protein